MKVTIPTTKEIDVKYVMVTVPVDEQDDIPLNFFGRRMDGTWSVLIDVDTGVIQGCIGHEFDLFMKVVDQGIYELLSADYESFTTLEGYVPNELLPGRYGDTLELKIDATGKITNWKPRPSFAEFFKGAE